MTATDDSENSRTASVARVTWPRSGPEEVVAGAFRLSGCVPDAARTAAALNHRATASNTAEVAVPTRERSSRLPPRRVALSNTQTSRTPQRGVEDGRYGLRYDRQWTKGDVASLDTRLGGLKNRPQHGDTYLNTTKYSNSLQAVHAVLPDSSDALCAAGSR